MVVCTFQSSLELQDYVASFMDCRLPVDVSINTGTVTILGKLE
jgi:hypothetical protein